MPALSNPASSGKACFWHLQEGNGRRSTMARRDGKKYVNCKSIVSMCETDVKDLKQLRFKRTSLCCTNLRDTRPGTLVAKDAVNANLRIVFPDE